jgi:beta-lactamase class A
MSAWAPLLVAGLAVAAGELASAPKAPARGSAADEAKCTAPFRFESKHPVLQASLEKAVREAGWQKWVDKKIFAVALVDLTRRGQAFYAGVNDDVMLYAASLPKIAILLAVAELAERQRIPWHPDFAVRLRKMITVSDNVMASWGWDLAGPRGIALVLRLPQYCLYAPPHGGLWVGRPFRKSATPLPDPLFDLSHGATARQAARFYVLLDGDRLVSPYWSARLRDLMGPPEYVHKFVAALRDRPGVRFVARKSGTWRSFHSDSALIQHHHRRYVLVGLAEAPDGEQLLRRLAVLADDLIARGEHRRGPDLSQE